MAFVVIPSVSSSGSGSTSHKWVAWLMVGLFSAAAALSLISSILLILRKRAMQQVRLGKVPAKGTAWLVPSSCYRNRQQNYEAAYLPDNASCHTVEVGYYDSNGNYVDKTETSPPPFDPENDQITELNSNNSNPQGLARTQNSSSEADNTNTGPYPTPNPPAPAKH